MAFTYTYGGVRMSKPELLEGVLKGHDFIFDWQPKKLWDHYYKDGIYFIDHHQSHAAYAVLAVNKDIIKISVNFFQTFFIN